MSEDTMSPSAGTEARMTLKELVEIDWRVATKLADVLTQRGQASVWQYRDLLAAIEGKNDPRRVALALVVDLGSRRDMKILKGFPEAFSVKAARNRRVQWKMADGAEGMSGLDFDEALHRMRSWYGTVHSWIYRFGSEGCEDVGEPVPADDGRPSADVLDMAAFRKARGLGTPVP